MAAVTAAVAAVTDPEYPDVTITELGMLLSVHVEPGAVDAAGAPAEPLGTVTVELLPTVLGCPALRTIEADVRSAALAAGAGAVRVRFLNEPAWTPQRIAPSARRRLAQEYTITLRGADGSLRCPVCGSAAVTERSPVGPARCRAVAYCEACRNPVEVIR